LRDRGFNAKRKRSVLERLSEKALPPTLYQLTCHQPVAAASPTSQRPANRRIDRSIALPRQLRQSRVA